MDCLLTISKIEEIFTTITGSLGKTINRITVKFMEHLKISNPPPFHTGHYFCVKSVLVSTIGLISA